MKAQLALQLKKARKRMDNRRLDLLKKLEKAVATAAPDRLEAECQALCFQILYGLPTELQLRGALHMCARYLPIFERKQPSVTWARRILDNPGGWGGKEWNGVWLDDPEGADSADTDYSSGFCNLFHARKRQEDPARLAANACGTMAKVASARARNVWLADDPEAGRIEREEDAFWVLHQEYRPDAPDPDPPALFKELESPAHGRYYNVAFIAVYRREWGVVAAWLRSEAVWQYPEPEDMDAMMQALALWQREPLFPIAHTWEEDGYPPDGGP